MKGFENQLREMFRDKEPDAPAVKPLSEYLAANAGKSRRRWQWVAVPAVVVATAAVVLGVAALSGMGGGEPDPPVAGSPSSQPSDSTLQGHGALGSGPAVSCVEEYSPSAVAERSFAFDGTVTGIEPGTTNREGEGQLVVSAVTFKVDEWFTGGTGETVTVDMMIPVKEWSSAEDRQSLGVGTRLLVSGQPRWGGLNPLADAIAWGCGFTRYWDEQTADAWRAASIEWKESLSRAGCKQNVTGNPDYSAGGPTAPVDETPPIELAASTVEGFRLDEDFPDVSVVVGKDYDVNQVIWIVSKDRIIGELSYARGVAGWYLTEMSYC